MQKTMEKDKIKGQTAAEIEEVRKNLETAISKMSKNKDYYSIRRIVTTVRALYYMIFGERSDGKTYSVLEFMIIAYWLFGYEGAIIRRWDEDFKGKRGHQMFKNLISNDVITKVTNGEWTSIYYYSSQWYFSKIDEKGKRILAETPFCYGFSLNAVEHDKSTGYPKVKIILFDEFLTRDIYLNDEFVSFTNTLSTIIRERGDAIIFMCGNTVNQFCPYFSEMGITKARKMEQGDLDTYVYGEKEELVVAVERTGVKDKSKRKKKASDKYFAFDNPKLNMITNGAWEIAIYPHLPYKYKPSDVMFTYFIIYNEFVMQCEIINVKDDVFTFIHRKSSPVRNDEDLVFSTAYSPNPYHRRKITKPNDDLGRKIYWFYKNDKIFYQDNELGEVVRNYLVWSNTDRGII